MHLDNAKIKKTPFSRCKKILQKSDWLLVGLTYKTK